MISTPPAVSSRARCSIAPGARPSFSAGWSNWESPMQRHEARAFVVIALSVALGACGGNSRPDVDIEHAVQTNLGLAQSYMGKGDFEAALDKLHRSEEHTSELQSLMRISYAVFCLKKK